MTIHRVKQRVIITCNNIMRIITIHKIKRKGEKFYPMYRGWSTFWFWKHYVKDYWTVVYNSIKGAIIYIDKEKEEKKNKRIINYKM